MAEHLLTPTQIGDRVGVDHGRVLEILDAAGIKPMYERSLGLNRKMRLYEPAAATAAVVEALEEMRRVRGTQGTPEPAPRARIDLDGVEERITQAVGDVEVQLEQALEMIKRLVDQNVVLWRGVDQLRKDIEGLSAKVDALKPAAQAAVPATAAPPAVIPPTPVVAVESSSAAIKAAVKQVVTQPATQPAAAQAKRLRVAVVGLLGDQRQMIEREFGEALDLRFFDSAEVRSRNGLSGTSGCDFVVVMMNFASRGMDAVVRAAGQRLVRVNGGMAKLRDKLTELYVNGSEAKAA